MSWRKGFLAFCKLLSGDPPEPEPSHQGTHAPSAGSRQTFPRPRPQSWEPQTAENLRKEKVSFLKVEEAVRWSCEPLRGGWPCPSVPHGIPISILGESSAWEELFLALEQGELNAARSFLQHHPCKAGWLHLHFDTQWLVPVVKTMHRTPCSPCVRIYLLPPPSKRNLQQPPACILFGSAPQSPGVYNSPSWWLVPGITIAAIAWSFWGKQRSLTILWWVPHLSSLYGAD